MKGGSNFVRAALLLTVLSVGAELEDCFTTRDGNTYRAVYIAADTACFAEEFVTPDDAALPCDCALAAEAAGFNSFTFTDGVCKLYPIMAHSDEGDVKVYTVDERLENSVVPGAAVMTVNTELNFDDQMEHLNVTWELDDPCDEVESIVLSYRKAKGDVLLQYTIGRESQSFTHRFIELTTSYICDTAYVFFILYNVDGDEVGRGRWTNTHEYEIVFTVNPEWNSNDQIDHWNITYELDDTCGEVDFIEVTYNNGETNYYRYIIGRESKLFTHRFIDLSLSHICQADHVIFDLHNAMDQKLATGQWDNSYHFDTFYGIETNVTIDTYSSEGIWCTFFTDMKANQSEADRICIEANKHWIFKYGIDQEVLDTITVLTDSWLGLRNYFDGNDYFQWDQEIYSKTLPFNDPLWLNPDDVPTTECAYMTSHESGMRIVAANCSEEHYVTCAT